MRKEIVGLDFETVLLRRLKGSRIQHKHYFISGQLFDANGGKIFYKPEEVYEAIASYPLFSTFGVFYSKYDYSVIAQTLPVGWSFRIMLNKGRFVKGVLQKNNKKWKVVDLRNIFPFSSLEQLGKFLGIRKYDKPKYLGERLPHTPDEKKEFERYAIRDAEICYYGLKWLIENLGEIKPTAPSYSLYLLKTFGRISNPFPKWGDGIAEKIRLSYRGGRCECFVRGRVEPPVFAYDINSLYPYIMTIQNLPVGFRQIKIKRNINLDKEGFADVEIKVEHDIPPIGIKYTLPDKMSKLVFPEGKFRYWLTYPELREIEGSGVGKIKKVYEAIEYPEGKPVLKTYGKWIWEQRLKSDAMGKIFKSFGVSCYGKLAQKGECEYYIIYGGNPTHYRLKPKNGEPKHNIAWASYITAGGRIYLWRLMRKLSPSEILYCDTDSIITTSRKLKSYVDEKKLGALKMEEPSDYIGVRAKAYIRGQKVVWKGLEHLPLNGGWRDWILKQIMLGKLETVGEKTLSLLEANRRHLDPLEVVQIRKCFSLLPDGKRIYTKDLNGKDLLFDYTHSQPLELGGWEYGK